MLLVCHIKNEKNYTATNTINKNAICCRRD